MVVQTYANATVEIIMKSKLPKHGAIGSERCPKTSHGIPEPFRGEKI